jgi:glycosyltransferase involved in cell wall biosynthesis
MVTSHSYVGRYWQDIAIDFKSRPEKLGFISLGQFPPPTWSKANDHVQYLAIGDNKIFGSLLLPRLFGRARAFKPDVIQTHLFRAGLVGLMFGRILRVPVVVTRHHIDEHVQSGSFIHRFLDRMTLILSNAVIVRSSAAKKWLISEESGVAKKIYVVNQGFDFRLLAPTSEQILVAKQELGFTEYHFEILCVARYSQTKGQEYLVQALALLAKDLPKLRLTFVGPGDSEWLSKLIQELNLENITKICPARDDVPACLAAADLVVHPSLVDSFSQLLIEAQAVGTAVIATDIAAASEQISNGISGIIVPPRDQRALALAISQLHLDPKLRESMGKEGAKLVRQKYQVKDMVEKDLEVLRSFL